MCFVEMGDRLEECFPADYRCRNGCTIRPRGVIETATSIVLAQVHSGVHVRHLLGVTIEHERLSYSATKKRIGRFTDALLARLAPSWVIHCGVDVRMKAIRLWPRFHPGTGGLLLNKTDFGDRLNPLEAVFPRRHESQRCAVLIRQRFPIHSRS